MKERCGMSFSAEVKEELEKVLPTSRHCQLAELAAMIHFGCCIKTTEKGEEIIEIQSENDSVRRKYFTLSKKTFIINNCSAKKVLQAVKLLDENGHSRQISHEVSSLLIKNSCCKRAFLRGAFLCLGSMSDPHKGYHLEFVCDKEAQAQHLIGILHEFGIEAKEERFTLN